MRGPATRVPLSRRIFWAMLVVTALGFALTAATTLKNFSDLDITYNAKRLLRKEAAMAKSLNYALHDAVGDTIEAYALSWSVMPRGFAERIVEIAKVHNQAFAVYRLDGSLFVSSTVSSPENEGFSIQVDPEVTIALAQGTSRYVVPLGGGSNMAYWYQRNNDGRPVALVAARYAERKLDELGRREFMGNMAAVYFVILLAAALLAWTLSRSIARPLKQIGEAMDRGAASDKFELIEFQGSEEISHLVNQFNRMVDRVRTSSEALAHSEREGAWRQMAMQVAHEIKNPLTPMKLGIQQLERAISDDAPDLNERFAKLATVLHGQIDSLSRMATGFSSLAHIPQRAHESVRIADVLADVLALHRRVDVGPLEAPPSDAFVQGDREQLVRLFGNLVINAQQAIGKSQGSVHFEVHAEAGALTVSVVDNGPGVTGELMDRIFEPQFTTRGSGTGLGLAISRAIAEDHGAQIGLNSNTEGGATFWVRWPVNPT